MSFLPNDKVITANLIGVGLGPGDSIVSTSWELSNDPYMNEILEHSYFDTVNKYSYIFQYEPQNGETYYVRASCVLTSGPTEYGPITELKFDETTTQLEVKLPSVIETPMLSTPFWETEHPHTCFTITASDFLVVGNSIHSKTEWVIRNAITQKVVFKSLSSEFLTELFVDIKLNYNQMFVIEATYISDSGDRSQPGSLVISTTNNIMSLQDLDLIDSEETLTIFKDVEFKPNLQYEWMLYNERMEKVSPTWDGEGVNLELTEVPSFTISEQWLEKDTQYLLVSRTLDPTAIRPPKFRYLSFKTLGELIYGLPGSFPYKLGIGNSSGYDSEKTIYE